MNDCETEILRKEDFKMEHIVVQSVYKNGDITRIGFGIAAVEEYD